MSTWLWIEDIAGKAENFLNQVSSISILFLPIHTYLLLLYILRNFNCQTKLSSVIYIYLYLHRLIRILLPYQLNKMWQRHQKHHHQFPCLKINQIRIKIRRLFWQKIFLTWLFNIKRMKVNMKVCFLCNTNYYIYLDPFKNSSFTVQQEFNFQKLSNSL